MHFHGEIIISWAFGAVLYYKNEGQLPPAITFLAWYLCSFLLAAELLAAAVRCAAVPIGGAWNRAVRTERRRAATAREAQ